MIIQEDYRIGFFVNNCQDDDEIQSWIDRLMDEYHAIPSDNARVVEKTRTELENLCFKYFQKLHKRSIVFQGAALFEPRDPTKGLICLIRAAITIYNKAFFDEIVVYCAASLPQVLCSIISNALNGINFIWCQEGYVPLFFSRCTESNRRCRLHKALAQIRTVHHLHQVSQSIRTFNDSKRTDMYDSEALEQWILSETRDSLKNIYTLEQQDAPLLMEMGIKYGSSFFIDRSALHGSWSRDHNADSVFIASYPWPNAMHVY